MNAIGYLRVSTDGQVGADKFGLEVQRKNIEKYCKENDISIVAWISDEGECGAKERPGFDKIVYGDISNPPYEAVIVAKSDRVARDICVYYYYKMMLTKKDIKLISVAEDFGQMGVFSSMLESFTICVAEMERNNITKRTSAGRKAKANHGGYAGGKAPYGYTSKRGSGKLEVNEEEAKFVRLIFALHDSGETLKSIVNILKSEGYKTRKGTDFQISTVQYIIKNRMTYRGFRKYGDSQEWVKGTHEPLLK